MTSMEAIALKIGPGDPVKFYDFDRLLKMYPSKSHEGISTDAGLPFGFRSTFFEETGKSKLFFIREVSTNLDTVGAPKALALPFVIADREYFWFFDLKLFDPHATKKYRNNFDDLFNEIMG